MSTSLADRFHAARTNRTLAVLEGFHAIKHALRFGAAIEIVVTPDVATLTEFAGRMAPDIISRLLDCAIEIPIDTYRTLSPTPHDSGVIAIARRPRFDPDEVLASDSIAPIVLLESPAHSGNIGAVIRVAAAAGATAVFTTGTNDPWNPGAVRGSAGLHFALPVIHAELDLIRGRPLVAIDPDGEDLGLASVPANAILAFGTERGGLSAALLDRAQSSVRIPMEPGVSSLNLATAVAVMLYRWKLQ